MTRKQAGRTKQRLQQKNTQKPLKVNYHQTARRKQQRKIELISRSQESARYPGLATN
jgi:hypothetical protein